jgi:hypothetical protein
VFYFKSFKDIAAITATTTVKIKCTNYNNPIYDTKNVGPFTIKITDREEPANEVATYPDIYVDIENLLEITHKPLVF